MERGEKEGEEDDDEGQNNREEQRALPLSGP